MKVADKKKRVKQLELEIQEIADALCEMDSLEHNFWSLQGEYKDLTGKHYKTEF